MTRLWHNELIDSLPRMWLLSQLRECSGISNMHKNDTLNHATVNRIKEYSKIDLKIYCQLVIDEMYNRGYKVGIKAFKNMDLANFNYFKDRIDISIMNEEKIIPDNKEYEEFLLKYEEFKSGKYKIFKNWMNDRYLKQCYYMFEEKYDCGMLEYNEFEKIRIKTKSIINI